MTEPCPPATQEALLRMSGLLTEIMDDMTQVARVVTHLSGHTAVTLTADQIQDLQSIDRMCQSLRDLVVVTQSLAATPGSDTDALAQLQLAKTRSILSPESVLREDATSGSVELF